ncbi:hypothetical protein OG895_38605 [Streptomyces sp. NBC_00201]|uniref:hypothetical protein n=1 Tax=unclassified Streptomyces TaxID=2593676 RepID=UPI002251B241|nr:MULTISPECIES: hypothetical protein [unclassified Streptomyces]MCX5063205.1 hypothetical protein [Streptomyces sp. NBC_00452]MCX5251045.1 hypothetical protein [Streptomyces sp. NBC_00201]MCX5291026.1 hypothetical protein [Streptomyces sp. NBC_00183]
MTNTRLAALGDEDPPLLALAQRLLAVAESGLPSMLLPGGEAFVHTMAGRQAPDGSWTLERRGTSTRYAAITVLGARYLPEDRQRAVLGGRTAEEFAGLLVESLPAVTNLGDAALIAWAAAETEHPKLSDALDRVEALNVAGRPQYTVEAAWVLSALAAARDTVDVERRFTAARDRLLRARIGNSPLFPHATAPGLVPWYRAHVSCFADQTYPLQALARAHASGDGDPEALAASEACAARICELQGEGGQWWWHYDARTGGVVEGYPVYSVHQHAMAPTALFDLADAGGTDFGAAIRKSLRWMTDVPELAGSQHREPMILDELGATWRKVYRGDPKKAVRAARGLSTRVAPGLRLKSLDRVYRPLSVDRECRPYEFGWMLYAWQGGRI